MQKKDKTDKNFWKCIKTKIYSTLWCDKANNKSSNILKNNGYLKDNGYLKVTLGIFGMILILSGVVSAADNSMLVKVAGFRSSDYGGPLNGNKYGHDQIDPAYWVMVAQKMSAKFPGSSPGAQYVVGYIETPETNTYMPFPAPAGYKGMPNVDFGPTGIEEKMLTAFDNAGMKIILQVEPGDADVPKLATMILNKFKNHSSVVGFGVDTEWLNAWSYKDGRPATDAEIKTWLNAVHAVNPNYKLLVKHWLPSHLGSGHIAGVTYITDSLALGSYQGAINEYVSWANAFKGSEIGYQIGYEEDMKWWLPIADPAKSIITDIKTKVPSADIYSVYWVDFAITKEFPNQGSGPSPTRTNALTVESPNGGENWRNGTTQTITWSTVGNPGSSVKIELLRSGSVVRTISSSTPNNGSYSWTIPSRQTSASNYKIRITSRSDSAYKDTSNNNFAITFFITFFLLLSEGEYLGSNPNNGLVLWQNFFVNMLYP